MLELTRQFASCLRASGARVSTAEVLDVLRQLPLIDPLCEVQFRAALKANFSKSVREDALFNRVYDLFFHQMRLDADLGAQTPDRVAAADRIAQALKERDGGRSPVFDAVAEFLGGSPQRYLRELARIDETSDGQGQANRFNFGPLAVRFNILMSITQAGRALEDLGREDVAGLDLRQRREVLADFSRRLETARELLMLEGRMPAPVSPQVKTYQQRLRELGERSFSSFTAEELGQMREAIDRLVRKLKDIISRRYAVRDRGPLDVKKTLRAAARFGGVPLDIRCRKKVRRKSRIVTLCDVSGSVWAAARFLLNLLYSLQECFDRVQSFVFVDRLTDVGAIFDRHDVSEAVRIILEEADVHFASPTDYGATLRHFHRDYMHLLTPRTTLIIVGDGRSNYLHPEDAILGRMRERCRRVIWLNPEPERLWGTGDSEIKAYMPHCHEVRACGNVNQLITFIEELVL